MSSLEVALPKVVITGGCGNLGQKLAQHLLAEQRWQVHLIEHPAYYKEDQVPAGCAITLGDVADMEGGLETWGSALDGADALVHFSAVNPYPNADWAESALTMDHLNNVFLAACSKGVRRVVFATSNHVMGQYKDAEPPLAPGSLSPSMPPMVGTPVAAVAKSGDAIAYAAAKLAGERLAMSCAALYAPRTTFVCLRIGWCQPGENLPGTLSAEGSPPQFLNAEDAEGGGSGGSGEDAASSSVDERWFKSMWLSNRDFLAYFTEALSVDVPLAWPAEVSGSSAEQPHRNLRRGFMLLNAMSRNSGAAWSLDETVAHLKVVSEDDSFGS